MREKDIEKWVKDYSRKLGWLPFKFTSPAQRGVPDCVFLKEGVIIFIEFKALGKQPTKLQLVMAQKMKEHGALVFLIDSREKGKDLFDKFEEEFKDGLS